MSDVALDATYRALEPKIVKERCPYCAGSGRQAHPFKGFPHLEHCRPCAGRGYVNTEAKS